MSALFTLNICKGGSQETVILNKLKAALLNYRFMPRANLNLIDLNGARQREINLDVSICRYIYTFVLCC